MQLQLNPPMKLTLSLTLPLIQILIFIVTLEVLLNLLLFHPLYISMTPQPAVTTLQGQIFLTNTFTQFSLHLPYLPIIPIQPLFLVE